MPAPASSASSQWTRHMRYSDQSLRVSDAERNVVAERLSAHYADGRLDQAEFDERVGQAMAAKTRGDLAGLFDDLPDAEQPMSATGPGGTGGPGSPAMPFRSRRRRGGIRPLLLLVLGVVALSIAWHAVASFSIPWFPLVAILAIVFFVRRSSHHHHHHHR